MDRDNLLGSARGLGQRGLHAGFSELGGFQKFILRGNVIDLAVGVVIGAAFGALVTAFTTDFITPLIGGLTKVTLLQWAIRLPNGNNLLPGPFINSVIIFLITAAIIYFFVVRPVNALQDRFTPHKEPAKPTTRECPFCLSTVPLKATRCAYCTAQLPPAETAAVVS